MRDLSSRGGLTSSSCGSSECLDRPPFCLSAPLRTEGGYSQRNAAGAVGTVANVKIANSGVCAVSSKSVQIAAVAVTIREKRASVRTSAAHLANIMDAPATN
eukprot:COSAG02_NODE_22129_length_762_cov_1.365008_1_plen_101_part_10